MPIKIDPPRVNQFKPVENTSSPFADRDVTINMVSLEIVNFDDAYKKDVKRGKGFLITNTTAFDEKTGVRTDDGLYSPKYGIYSFSDEITDDYYRCECGATTGSLNEGAVCPECGTKVQFIDTDLDIFGYIPLGENFTIINPAMYTMLTKLIGEKDLNLIIQFNNRYNVSGKNVSTRTKQCPYAGIGMIEFKRKFTEICDYYANKKKQYEALEIIEKFKDAAFAHYIPVYSALLRPMVKDDAKISTVDDNKNYSVILANANAIRETEIDGIDRTVIFENCLYEIQTELMTIYHNIVDNCLSSKKGVIRGQVTCNRVDYSGRCVIVPGRGLCCNEIELPYAMGVELMRPLLINQLSITKNISAREANSQVDAALRKYDKGIWFIMNHIVMKSDNPPMCMVQRSPSLLQESLRLMKIKDIKADIDDLTLDVPVAILDLMNK